MLKKLNKSNKGFTIIEVLIVLAIAALILLIVLLAVPALQRSQRNTSRKQDAGRVAAAINSFISNHNASPPTATADATAIVNDAGTLGQYPGMTGASPVTTAAKNKLSIITAPCLVPGTTGAINVDGMQIVNCSKCNTAANDGSTTAGNSRSTALQYVTENSDGTFTGLCQDI